MRIFETHAHLNFKNYKKDREQVIKKAMQKGVSHFINIGIDEESSKESIELAEKYDNFSATVGYHPHDADKFDAEVVRKLAKHKEVVAIGEIGLDYYKMRTPKKIQKKVFEEQVKIALELNKPIVVHDRDAHEDTFEILDRLDAKKVVFHCFAGDEFFAQRVIAKGWFISITGVVTFKNSGLQRVVRNIPLDKLMVETDCPFLTPHPYRGKRNSPEYLPYIISKIADLKLIPPKKVAEAAYLNAENFFLEKS